MERSTLVVFVSQAAQAGGALVMALVLVGFHRLYQREYLRTWAWSWWAFCAWMATSALGQLLAWSDVAMPEIQTVLIVLSMIGAYWHVCWLLFGTYELATTRSVPEKTETLVLGALVLLAVLPMLLWAGASAQERLITQECLRNAFLAMAYLVASYWIWNAGNEEVSAGLGQRIMSGAFLLNSIQELHYLAIHLGPSLLGFTPTYEPLLVPFDFLLQFLLGTGMVIWLLEEERRRVVQESARAEHLAYHDSLTDLPNRNLLVQHVAQALHRAERRPDGRAAVLFLDLDRFKVINDSLGHNYGDEILRAITERLRRNLLETETVARLGGDGFAVLLPVVSSEWKIAQAADKILGLVRRPFAVQGTELYVTTSVGISRFPDDGGDPDELLKKAEIAMYHAKEHGGDQYQVYAPTMDANALERLALENDLRKALVHGELVLFYQPVLDARTGCIESVEALLRWQHPERGLMGPAEFLWLAEVTGMSNAVDLWVLRTACREIAEWHADGAEVRVAVNLSARPFQRPDLLDRIQEVLAESGLPANMLQLEITETLAMQNAEASQAVLRGLKELGIRVAIDDFGTGYSSLSYLTSLPIDILKVDRSFVSGLGTDRGSGEITAA
ncbi:MAG: EAL domain-containing protein, partial [Acidobacteriota bacterium]